MRTSVYVAGSSKDRIEIQRIIDRIKVEGVYVSHDWTRSDEFATDQNNHLSDGDRRLHAMADLRGVADCDLFWFVMLENQSEGAFCELGYALALRKTVIVSGERAFGPGRFFTTLADKVFADHYDAERNIVALATGNKLVIL